MSTTNTVEETVAENQNRPTFTQSETDAGYVFLTVKTAQGTVISGRPMTKKELAVRYIQNPIIKKLYDASESLA